MQEELSAYDYWSMFYAGFDWISVAGVYGYRQPLRYKPHYMATWVTKGSVYKKMGREVVTANAGEWVFQQPGEVISHFDGRYIEVAFNLQWIGKDALLFPPRLRLWKAGPLPELEEETKRLRNEVLHKFPEVASHSYQMRSHPTSMGDWFWLRSRFDHWMVALDRVWQEHGKTPTEIRAKKEME